MLRVFNKTDNALSIENYELPEGSSVDIDIPYTSNLKMMEKYNMIAVVEVQDAPEEQVENEPIQQEPETSADESEIEEPVVTKRKRSKKTNN